MYIVERPRKHRSRNEDNALLLGFVSYQNYIQFVAERAQLENYLRSVSEHVKALQESSNANTERFNGERQKLEEELETMRDEAKSKQEELRRERDQVLLK